MNLDSIRAQLEADFKWRQDELRFLQNQGASLSESDLEIYRRALIVILYAHFEGFCKFALTVYVNCINGAGIKCDQANYALAAASLADLFAALRNPTQKCAVFKNALPDDSKLHRFARDREFVERASYFGDKIVNISDSVIDTESNLKPIVLRKILYQLGLPHDLFKPFDGSIDRLLGMRNKISHGETKSGVTRKNYDEILAASFAVMTGITIEITNALMERRFSRN
ncbi:MAE_28990/MAE_18760 family HEPN-like nuclease [Termitidicoccus mucosus]|uniref:MAE_28990/MAE_18760 family HEPN-like nuclease n=1 Tax=Termitidicoccus mucosus TaxID=1184151 RepID=UPI0031840EFD